MSNSPNSVNQESNNPPENPRQFKLIVPWSTFVLYFLVWGVMYGFTFFTGMAGKPELANPSWLVHVSAAAGFLFALAGIFFCKPWRKPGPQRNAGPAISLTKHEDLPELDISTSFFSRSKERWRLISLVLVGVTVFLMFKYKQTGNETYAYPLYIGAAVLVTYFGWQAWNHIGRYWVFMYFMRATRLPFEAMAKGNPERAETAFQLALSQAQQYKKRDFQLGIMYHVLAVYLKNQARRVEAAELFAKSIEILEQYRHREPSSYFRVLIDYASFYIDVKQIHNALRILETAQEHNLNAAKKGAGSEWIAEILYDDPNQKEFILHQNFFVLFLYANAPSDAKLHLQQIWARLEPLGCQQSGHFHDVYLVLLAIWHCAGSRYDQAEKELSQVKDRGNPYLPYVQAKVSLGLNRYADAEKASRAYAELERKNGTLARPELLDAILDLAESLYGQGNYKDGAVEFEKARRLVIDFELPCDAEWRTALQNWTPRIKELGITELAELLETELAKSSSGEPGVTLYSEIRRAISASK